MAENKKLAKLKEEVATEVGFHPIEGYQGDMKTKEAGHLGGSLGGNMVRKMVAAYAQQDENNK